MSTNTNADEMTGDEQQLPLDEAGETTLPIVEVLTGRGFITGKSGSGKSNSASVIIEELLDRGFPVLIVDTDGEYWGLKESYEILHVGADEECDLQVGPEHAEKLAQLALEESVPIILDVSGYLDEEDASALVRETASALFAKEKKLNKPFLMLVEEIHEYLPEGAGSDETARMLTRVAKRGRKRGLGLCGMSQRPADVKKDFITQCDWLMWHRLTWENDTKVVGRVIGSDYKDPVQDLADGEAFLMADFLDADVQRVQVRRKRTFDAGATPDLGEYERPELKSVSGNLVDELEEISEKEERRKDRTAQLEQRIEEKDDTIDQLQDELEQARDMTDMAEQFSQALMQSAGKDDGGEALQEKIDEIREEKNARIAELEQENEAVRDDLREVRQEKVELEERVAELEEYEQAVEHMDELREAVTRMNEALGIDAGSGDEKLRKRLEKKNERIEQLEQQAERLRSQSGAAIDETLEEYEDFLHLDEVQAEIEAAKEEATCAQRYIKGVLAGIVAENGPVKYSTIAERLGVSTTSDVSKAASELERRKIVTKDKRNGEITVDLNTAGIEEIRRAAAEREKTEELMEEL